MKTAYIVTSVINARTDRPLTYSATRTVFSADDRLRHTIMTVASLDQICDENSTIYLLDMSDNWQQYKSQLAYQTNLKFISIKEEFSEIFDEVTTHANKSRCETLVMSEFLKKYKSELINYDFITKVSGRYFIDGSFNPEIFSEQNKGKVFYKKPLEFEWSDSWQYQMVDRRIIQQTNTLKQYSSVIFSWSIEYYDQFQDMFTRMTELLNQPSMMHYDIETLSYFFTRQYSDDIIETDWIVYGWDGTNGRFLRY